MSDEVRAALERLRRQFIGDGWAITYAWVSDTVDAWAPENEPAGWRELRAALAQADTALAQPAAETPHSSKWWWRAGQRLRLIDARGMSASAGAIAEVLTDYFGGDPYGTVRVKWVEHGNGQDEGGYMQYHFDEAIPQSKQDQPQLPDPYETMPHPQGERTDAYADADEEIARIKATDKPAVVPAPTCDERPRYRCWICDRKIPECPACYPSGTDADEIDCQSRGIARLRAALAREKARADDAEAQLASYGQHEAVACAKIREEIEAERDAEKARADAAEASEKVRIASVLGTIGGTVEGYPTGSHNYLQRLRALVATEKASAAMRRNAIRADDSARESERALTDAQAALAAEKAAHDATKRVLGSVVAEYDASLAKHPEVKP